MTRTLRAGSGAGPAWWADQGGYTLLEMLVVLALLALAWAMVAGYAPIHLRSHQLNLEAYRLESALRLARSSAIFGGQPVLFTVDVAQGTWRYGRTPAHAVPQGFSLALYTGRQLRSGATAGAIEFFPNGQSSGGHVTVRGAGFARQVDVDWLTGGVHQHQADETQ